MLKKIISCSILLSQFAISFAQETVTFETINLAPESYNNGSAGTGGFTFGNAHFSNDYNDPYWSGFTVSNTKDNTTPGYLNDFSAFTGGGFNSNTYAIFYDYDHTQVITFDAPGALLQSLQITNTTFAALAMRDGDFVCKKFGSTINANGDEDGTNGEDFFKIWVYAHNNMNEKIDSLDFYLADFRFSDNSKDYILDSWVELDLTPLNDQPIFKLTFSFESSDIGDWGINTPTYFAIDDLKYYSNLNVGENLASKVMIYPNPVKDVLNIQGEEGVVSLKDANGRVLSVQEYKGSIQLDFSDLSNGFYFLEIQYNNHFSVHQIVK